MSIFSDRFYSVAEVADTLGYHPDSIYRAIQRGELPATKPRGKWLIAGPGINSWLQGGQVVAPPAPRRPSPARSGQAGRRGNSSARPSFRELARRRRAS